MVGGKVDGQILFGARSEKPKMLYGARGDKRKNLFGAKWHLRKIVFGSQRVKDRSTNQLAYLASIFKLLTCCTLLTIVNYSYDSEAPSLISLYHPGQSLRSADHNRLTVLHVRTAMRAAPTTTMIIIKIGKIITRTNSKPNPILLGPFLITPLAPTSISTSLICMKIASFFCKRS